MYICTYIHISREAMHSLIKALKALSDETRLRVMKVLMERECCVCEIMQALDISQTRASRNLSILQDIGFLKSRRDGLWVVYSVDWKAINRHVMSLIRLIKNLPLDDEIFTQDKERLKRAVRIGPGCRQNR
jgi:ArsR family transcriptional regulator